MDQRRRGVVEEVGIIDEDGQTLPFGLLDQGGGRPAKEISPVVDRAGLTVVEGGQQRGERPERELGG